MLGVNACGFRKIGNGAASMETYANTWTRRLAPRKARATGMCAERRAPRGDPGSSVPAPKVQVYAITMCPPPKVPRLPAIAFCTLRRFFCRLFAFSIRTSSLRRRCGTGAGLRLRGAAPGHLGPLLVPGRLVPRGQLRARGERARLLRARDLRARRAVPPLHALVVRPTPAAQRCGDRSAMEGGRRKGRLFQT